MLAVVKTPHTEISINGEMADAIFAHLKKKFAVELVAADPDDEETVNIFETDFWRENKHHVLAGARLKHEMSQEELAEKSGISQSVISQYESGKRKITMRAAIKLGKALDEKPECLVSE